VDEGVVDYMVCDSCSSLQPMTHVTSFSNTWKSFLQKKK
jgi:hypothetical protein